MDDFLRRHVNPTMNEKTPEIVGEAKRQRAEKERLRTRRLNGAQQDIINLLPPVLLKSGPKTQKFIRVIHYGVFLELLLAISLIPNKNTISEEFRLLPLFFGPGFLHDLDASQLKDSSNKVDAIQLQRLFFHMRLRIRHIMEQNFRLPARLPSLTRNDGIVAPDPNLNRNEHGHPIPSTNQLVHRSLAGPSDRHENPILVPQCWIPMSAEMHSHQTDSQSFIPTDGI